jgi:hypothetical protein
MPKYLRVIARYANGILALLNVAVAVHALSGGKTGGAFISIVLAALLMFNLYLIEKASLLLSEEEWLKAQIRKTLLRRRLANLDQEERASAGGRPGDECE